MATLADLRARIADDLARGDLTVQIEDAVRDAVRLYEAERLGFNEFYRVTASLSASSGSVALAALPITVLAVDRLRRRDAAGTWCELPRRGVATIAALQDTSVVAGPSCWCISGTAIEFDTVADRNYGLLLDGVRQISTASAAADVSAWFNEARDLIRASAKKSLYLHVIKEAEQATACAAAEAEALAMLRGKINLKKAGGLIRPTSF